MRTLPTFLTLIVITSTSFVEAKTKVMDCGSYFYKLETNFLGLNKKFFEQLTDIPSTWEKICSNYDDIEINGLEVSCERTSLNSLRINKDSKFVLARKFICPSGNGKPNLPSFQEAEENDGIGFLYFGNKDESDFKEEHFKKVGCTFYGENIKVPLLELSTDGQTWVAVDFPSFYPFPQIFISNSKRDTRIDTLYEELVFKNGKSDKLPLTWGTKYEAIIDFEIRKYSSESYFFDDVKKEFTSNDFNTSRCNLIE